MTTISLWEILGVLILGSLAAVGGGAGASAMVQGQWVATGVLDPALFTWVVAVGNLTPGPKSVFLAGVGYYLRGVPGALAAFTGAMIPAYFGSVGVAYAFDRWRTRIGRVAVPASFVVAGLIVGSALTTARPLQLNTGEVAAAGVVAWLTGWRKVDPVWVVVAAIGVGLGLNLLS